MHNSWDILCNIDPVFRNVPYLTWGSVSTVHYDLCLCLMTSFHFDRIIFTVSPSDPDIRSVSAVRSTNLHCGNIGGVFSLLELRLYILLKDFGVMFFQIFFLRKLSCNFIQIWNESIWMMELLAILVIFYTLKLIIPLPQQRWKGIWFHLVRPSVDLSICRWRIILLCSIWKIDFKFGAHITHVIKVSHAFHFSWTSKVFAKYFKFTKLTWSCIHVGALVHFGEAPNNYHWVWGILRLHLEIIRWLRARLQ